MENPDYSLDNFYNGVDPPPGMACPSCKEKHFYPIEIKMKEVKNGTEVEFSCSLCKTKLVVFANFAGFAIRIKNKETK